MKAAGLLVTDDRELRLLLLQRLDLSWGIPGGFLDPGETPLQGAAREFQEETGYHGKLLVDPQPAAILYMRAGRLDVHHSSARQEPAGSFSYTVFRARVPKLFPPRLDGEHLMGGWFSAEEVEELRLHPGVRLVLRELSH